ncbi:hypothetical protein PVK06_029730 [Gossypium arboreum]|uniref:Uncharacterized protein n=1 Tax=Gossypium arboreum TaxID=29729 RepID=A0ABR0NMD9_GOSAR|nr:hypothetical protein PVK06_029730 [Gossypium arboreum]
MILPIEGDVVNRVVEFKLEQKMRRLLGHYPKDKRDLKVARVKLTWLHRLVEHPLIDDVNNEKFAQYVRAYILCVIIELLIEDKSRNLGYLMYLKLLEDITCVYTDR